MTEDGSTWAEREGREGPELCAWFGERCPRQRQQQLQRSWGGTLLRRFKNRKEPRWGVLAEKSWRPDHKGP